MSWLTGADYSPYNGSWQTTSAYDVGSISYDPNGNLLALQRSRDTGSLIDNLTYQYTSGKNRLNYVDDAAGSSSETWDVEDGASGAFTYDASGNVTKAQAPYGLTTLTYDERNLPLAITTGGVTTSYRYSDGGQRYWKKTGTNAGEYYALDGAVTVGVFSDAGAIKHWNILAGGAVVGRYESGAKRYYHRDHLGTTRVVVDASGTVKEARDYYPFGLAMPGRTTLTGTGAREGYTSKERDAETGLDYFGARYYMAALGRWGNVDPLAEKYAGWSPYNYVMGNPLALVDPDGMASCDITLCGQNGSSVTIETDLIDAEVDVSSLPGTDFGGNHTFDGEDLLLAGLDLVGIIDPTPTSDVLAASLYAKRGEVGNTLISGFGVIPLVGDAAKLLRAGKHADTISAAIRSLDDQAADLVKLNEGRNRVTLRSPSTKLDIDLAGREHGGVPTPHTKTSARNMRAPNQPTYNTKNAPVTPTTQQEMRIVRKYLKSKNK